MQWLGKVVGAALGMPFGWVGVAVGALLGHQFDKGLAGALPGTGSHGRQLFFTMTFELMGRVAKIDGRVTEEEVQTARRIMHGMRLSPEQVQQAIECFTAGKQPDYPLAQRLADLSARIGPRSELARAFLEIQVQAVIGSGDVAQSKRELLWRIAQGLGVNRVELAQMEATLRGGRPGTHARTRQPDLDSAYRTLGVEAGATDREVKTAYRRMMNLHHPDKLRSKGLPESMTAVAEQRTQQIRAAYDRVRADRGLR